MMMLQKDKALAAHLLATQHFQARGSQPELRHWDLEASPEVGAGIITIGMAGYGHFFTLGFDYGVHFYEHWTNNRSLATRMCAELFEYLAAQGFIIRGESLVVIVSVVDWPYARAVHVFHQADPSPPLLSAALIEETAGRLRMTCNPMRAVIYVGQDLAPSWVGLPTQPRVYALSMWPRGTKLYMLPLRGGPLALEVIRIAAIGPTLSATRCPTPPRHAPLRAQDWLPRPPTANVGTQTEVPKTASSSEIVSAETDNKFVPIEVPESSTGVEAPAESAAGVEAPAESSKSAAESSKSAAEISETVIKAVVAAPVSAVPVTPKIGSAETGAAETGAAETGAAETGPAETGAGDWGRGDWGRGGQTGTGLAMPQKGRAF